MTAKDFVNEIHNESLDDLSSIYLKRLEGPLIENDECWEPMRQLYQSLDPMNKKAFIDLMKWMQTDTLGSVFSLLDNQTFPETQEDDLELRHEGNLINGELTSIFFTKISDEEGEK